MFFARIVYAKARTRALQRTAPGRLRLSRLLLPADPPRSSRATLRRPSAVSELESISPAGLDEVPKCPQVVQKSLPGLRERECTGGHSLGEVAKHTTQGEQASPGSRSGSAASKRVSEAPQAATRS